MNPLTIDHHLASNAPCGPVSQFDRPRHSSGHCAARARRRDYRRMPLIRLNDADFMPDLVDALRDAGCLATAVRGDTCLVSPPPAEDQHFLTELTFFIKAWLVRHPQLEADLVG